MQASFTETSGDRAQTPTAVERGVKEKLAELERQVASVAAKTSEARQKRRALLADITTCTGKRKPPMQPLCSPPVLPQQSSSASTMRSLLTLGLETAELAAASLMAVA